MPDIEHGLLSHILLLRNHLMSCLGNWRRAGTLLRTLLVCETNMAHQSDWLLRDSYLKEFLIQGTHVFVIPLW